jgi:TorA maturation chaperone TorD
MPRSVSATARDLAAFHAERAAIYRVLAECIGVPPTPRVIAALRAQLEAANSDRNALLGELARAFNGADSAQMIEAYFRMIGGPSGLPDVRCCSPSDSARAETFRTAGLNGDERATAELLALAQLADQSARAIRHGDFGGAAARSGLQHRFLTDHASSCLERLAAALAASGFAPYISAAHVLRRAIDQDCALLAADPPLLPAGDGSPRHVSKR